MDYWISSQNVPKGPYSLEQLELMWQQGQLTSDTLYFESIRSEWLLLQTLVENNHQLFTAEEAIVRLGENRQKGCLLVYNKEEELHLFVTDGFIVCASSKTEQGELTLARALRLENSFYEWFLDAEPPAVNLHLNIQEYALKNAIARDVRVGSGGAGRVKRKTDTMALSMDVIDKVVAQLRFNYILRAADAPTMNLRLVKVTNVVGREDHCDLVIEDSKISRKHCLLEASEQNVKVKDLESRNGTSVNGVPITDGYLHVGDQLSLGGYVLTLHKEQKRAPEYNG